jgi:hypothetical protein
LEQFRELKAVRCHHCHASVPRHATESLTRSKTIHQKMRFNPGNPKVTNVSSKPTSFTPAAFKKKKGYKFNVQSTTLEQKAFTNIHA